MSVLARFLARRTPTGDHFRLNSRNVYVFFSRQGTLFVVLLLITFATGTNYANNLILGLFFYLLSLWLVCQVLTFWQLSGLNIALQSAGFGQAGGLVWVELLVSSDRATPARQISLSFYDKQTVNTDILSQAEQVQFAGQRTVTLPSVREACVVRLPVIVAERGTVRLPRLTIKSSYPLGVIQAWAYARFVSQALAYPCPVAPQLPDNAHLALDEAGQGAQSVSGQEDFDRLDTYNEGESLARVSWGHVARGMGMLTKHFADNLAPSTTLNYYAMPSATHEGKLSELAFLVLRTDTPFRLRLPSGQGALGAGEQFVRQSLIRLENEP